MALKRLFTQSGLLLTICWLLTTGLTICHATTNPNWTRFRGHNGQGIAVTADIPTVWDVNSVAWKTILPGEGHSSPVAWKNQIYLTCYTKSPLQGSIVALDANTGQILWKTEIPLTQSKLNSLNSYASSTIAVTEDCLYAIWPSGDELLLTALGHDGQKQWSHNYGPVYSRHGSCNSPIVYQDLVIFTQEQYEKQTEEPGRWLAVDRRNGEIRWQLKRTNRSPSYITPCLYTDSEGQDQLIFSSQAHGITAIHPLTGTVIWELNDLLADRTIGSPILANNCIIAASGSSSGGKTLVFVKPGSATSQAQLLHTVANKLIPYIPSMIAVKDRLYAFHDRGTVSCWDIKEATPLWSESLKGKFYGSPIAIGDHIYCISTKGDVFVIKAADSFELLAINSLGEKSHATPAVINNALYVRTLTTLTCIK